MKNCSRFPFIDLLGVVLTCGLLGSRETLLGDPGVGWHLRAGEWICKHTQLPAADPFLLWLGAPATWIHDQWLSDVILWKIYAHGGIAALHALVAVVCVSTFTLILAPVLRRGDGSGLVAFLFLLLAALIASIQWFLRPVIFSVLLFAFSYRFALAVLARPEVRVRSLLLFTPLFALWANLHAGFWLGLGIFWALLLELVLRRSLSLVKAGGLASLALLFAAANPWGFSLWRNTLGLASDPYFLTLNQEWHPPQFSDAAFWPFYFALALLVLGLLGKNRKSISRFDLLLLIPLTLLSLLHRRYLPFFAVLLPLPLIKLIPSHAFMKCQMQHRCLPFVSLFLWSALLISSFTLQRIPYLEARTSSFPSSMPTEELEQINQEPGPIFHSPDIGGYISWTSYPRLKAFIDDRNQLIGRERYEEYFKVLRADAGWEEILQKWNIQWILLRFDPPLIKVIEASPLWTKVSSAGDQSWALFHLNHIPPAT